MIRQATVADLPALCDLALLLWPGHDARELEDELDGLLQLDDAAFFLAERDGGSVGFAQCQLRHDYVEGTSTSPVGYLEGVFVREEERGRGVARALVAACEAWAKARGCAEFASDCELANGASWRFHLRAGFEETNRIVCFRKALR